MRVADGDHGGRVTEQLVDAWPGIAFHVEKKQRAILKKNKKTKLKVFVQKPHSQVTLDIKSSY